MRSERHGLVLLLVWILSFILSFYNFIIISFRFIAMQLSTSSKCLRCYICLCIIQNTRSRYYTGKQPRASHRWSRCCCYYSWVLERVVGVHLTFLDGCICWQVDVLCKARVASSTSLYYTFVRGDHSRERICLHYIYYYLRDFLT